MKFKLELIAEARKWYTMYSIWFFAALGCLPDLFNLAIQNGLITSASAPVLLTRVINLVAFVGAASRLVKQKALAAETPTPPAS